MSAAKRALERRRRNGVRSAPFAWFRADLLVSQSVCGLSPAGVRVWLLLNANYHGEKGETVLPYAGATKTAGMGRAQIAAGFRECQDAGLAVLERPGTRPSRAGAARGLAAVWRLPHRERGEQPPVPLPPNVRRPNGKVILHCERIRDDVKTLSPTTLKLLVFAVGLLDRNAEGHADQIAFELPLDRIADLLGLSRATVKRALAELRESKRLVVVEAGKGTRRTTYSLGAVYARPPRQPRGSPVL